VDSVRFTGLAGFGGLVKLTGPWEMIGPLAPGRMSPLTGAGMPGPGVFDALALEDEEDDDDEPPPPLTDWLDAGTGSMVSEPALTVVCPDGVIATG
jgi:hypothetical protein